MHPSSCAPSSMLAAALAVPYHGRGQALGLHQDEQLLQTTSWYDATSAARSPPGIPLW